MSSRARLYITSHLTLLSYLNLLQILKLRGQAEEQEQSLKVQEEEVHTKKRELDVLIEEEARLNNDIKKSQREMENLVKSLSDVEKLLEEVQEATLSILISNCVYFRLTASAQSTKSLKLISMKPREDLTKFSAPLMRVSLNMYRRCTLSPSDTLSLSQTSPCWTSPASPQGPRLRALFPRRCKTGDCLPQTIPSATPQSLRLRPTTFSTTMMRLPLLTTRHQG